MLSSFIIDGANSALGQMLVRIWDVGESKIDPQAGHPCMKSRHEYLGMLDLCQYDT